MQVFAIFGMTKSDEVLERIRQRYPNDHYVVDEHAVLVAANSVTTPELAKTIGLDQEMGVVTRIMTYWGFHNPTLWEWISLKMARNGE